MARENSDEFKKLPRVTKEITHACIIRVEAGTNTPMGGDTGHGGRTVFAIEDLGSTDLRVEVIGEDDRRFSVEDAKRVEIRLGGDAECDVFVQALDHALAVLRAQRLLRGSEE